MIFDRTVNTNQFTACSGCSERDVYIINLENEIKSLRLTNDYLARKYTTLQKAVELIKNIKQELQENRDPYWVIILIEQFLDEYNGGK